MHSWYSCVALGIGIVCVLLGARALLPSGEADALKAYLVMPRALAASGSLEFQAFAHPFYGLLPLQVELHWTALFAISNETAVTVWDYLCGLGFVGGTALFAYSLTLSRRAALIAALIILSTPGFYELVGGAKVDNAAAQYGIAAFVCLTLLPALGRRVVALAGLFIGWALASRYTDIIVLPALVVFAVVVAGRGVRVSSSLTAARKESWVLNALVGALAAACAGTPTLIKNFLLVGCPLAPQFGCRETFWANMAYFTDPNLSVADLFLYPFVWTYANRGDMLGNVSPLFVGLLPLLLLYRRSPTVRPALAAALAGLVALTTWLLVEPLILFTRWLLVPLALLAAPLGAALVELDQDRGRDRLVRWSTRGAIVCVFLVLLFDSRGAVYGVRYLASIDSRAARYDGMSGYDVAVWLNARVQPGQRVALGGYRGYPYFLRPEILLESESGDELQWLWERGGRLSQSSPRGRALPRSTMGIKAAALSSSWTPDVWRFYVDHGFAYVVIARNQLDAALGSWPSQVGARLGVAFAGREDSLLRIARGKEAARLSPAQEVRTATSPR